jgi:phosphate transport system substrate-binding protein
VIAALLVATSLGSRAQDATPSANAVAPETALAQLSGRIIVDGSSTVWPIMVAAAERFGESASNVIVEVEFSGTGGGFRRFCTGASDVQDASRPITPAEEASCQAAGVQYAVFPVAYDGITVTVNPANTWVDCLTVEQLRAIWEPEQPESSWNQLDPAWPEAKIELYGPGPDSGTFDYFTEAIVGEVDASRTDYVPSENDLDLVEGVASQPNALGYFGFAYYEESAQRLRPVAVNSGAGCVLPSRETIADGSYAPLSRPLYLYVNHASLTRPEVQAFVRFTLDQATELVDMVGYVPLPEADYAADRAELEAMLVATPAA